MKILHIIETLLFVAFAINIVYLFVFSVASHIKRKTKNDLLVRKQNSFCLLIPAYKEDFVIMECVESCLKQNYPKELYDVVVISDRMSDETNSRLEALPVRLIKVFFENSTKAKALNTAMEQLDRAYDVAVVLDADNTVSPEFLNEVNLIFQNDHVKIVQAHRCAKNTNTPLALLDAVSEEINNSIFRLGHANLGLSAALIGSGMCFHYSLFKQTMSTIDAIGGFDRALELTLMKEGIRVYYLPNTDVLDEKVQQHIDFSNQRRRWLSAQLHYLRSSLADLPEALLHKKWDFCDKVFQQMSIPRVLLLGFSSIFTLLITIINPIVAIKWWVLYGLLTGSILLAIPIYLYNKKLLFAILQLPFFFFLMAINIFKLKGANKKFIHTRHGIK